MSDCLVCSDLWQFFTDPKGCNKSVIDLGSCDNALASPCPKHMPLVRHLIEYCERNGRPDSNTDEPTSFGFIKGTAGRNTRFTWALYSLSWTGKELLLVHRKGFDNHPGLGRILDPDLVDLDMVNKWKRECLSSHGGLCENPMKIVRTSPRWLLDVERMCMVPGAEHHRYVALSYRLGRAPTFRMQLTAMNELQEEDAISRSNILEQLPVTVTHAISLTSAIGERYLWTDALCIVHGDRAETSKELNLMVAIYANAVVTIVATDGDGLHGLPGLKGVSEPRNLRQPIFQFGEEQIAIRIEPTTGHHSEYHKRAWTYQEFITSPRKLILTENGASWQCQCCIWHEELLFGTQIDRGEVSLDRVSVLMAGFPDLKSLDEILNNYNGRTLTYDGDALAAVSGLLTMLSRTFSDGFLYGIPEFLFDGALAWSPYNASTRARKRQPSGDSAYIPLTASDLPSWSWVAWQGDFLINFPEEARVSKQESLEECYPITKWYTSRAPVGELRRPIHSKWFEARKQGKDLSRPLPQGWTRHNAPGSGIPVGEPPLYPDGYEKYVYKHNGMPYGVDNSWYYPFPVANIQPSTPYSMPEQTRYLFCKTWKATVWSRADNAKFSGLDLILHRSPRETALGRMRPMNEEQVDRRPEPESGDGIACGRWIEVVAINRTVRYSKIWYPEYLYCDHPLGRSEVFKVLWVEWKDNIAYRLACGEIDKDGWSSLDVEEIDLVLG